MHPSSTFSNYQHLANFFHPVTSLWGGVFKVHPRHPIISSINFSMSLTDGDFLNMTTVLLSNLTKLTIIPNIPLVFPVMFFPLAYFTWNGISFKCLLTCNNSPWLVCLFVCFLRYLLKKTESFVLLYFPYSGLSNYILSL